MSTEKDTTYNGHKNYETWSVDLWLSNEEDEYNGFMEIMHSPASSYNKAKRLKDYVEESFNIPTSGLAGQLVGAALSEVDWLEIVEDHTDDEEGDETE